MTNLLLFLIVMNRRQNNEQWHFIICKVIYSFENLMKAMGSLSREVLYIISGEFMGTLDHIPVLKKP